MSEHETQEIKDLRNIAVPATETQIAEAMRLSSTKFEELVIRKLAFQRDLLAGSFREWESVDDMRTGDIKRLQAEVAGLNTELAQRDKDVADLERNVVSWQRHAGGLNCRTLTDEQVQRARELLDVTFSFNSGFPDGWVVKVRRLFREIVGEDTQ